MTPSERHVDSQGGTSEEGMCRTPGELVEDWFQMGPGKLDILFRISHFLDLHMCGLVFIIHYLLLANSIYAQQNL